MRLRAEFHPSKAIFPFTAPSPANQKKPPAALGCRWRGCSRSMNIGCLYIPLEHSLSRGMNMQDINSLLDACKVAAGVSSDNQLAAALGVGRSAISNYRHARALPDPVVCATIAGLSGIPLARVLGVVGEARAISREEKAVWRKLAATAMALCLAVGFALPHKAQAAITGFDKSTVYTLCEILYIA